MIELGKLHPSTESTVEQLKDLIEELEDDGYVVEQNLSQGEFTIGERVNHELDESIGEEE